MNQTLNIYIYIYIYIFFKEHFQEYNQIPKKLLENKYFFFNCFQFLAKNILFQTKWSLD